MINISHLPADDAAELRQLMGLKQPPLLHAQLVRLRHDVKPENIRACAERKGLTYDEMTLRREALLGKQHFGLGCWLYFYSKRTGRGGVSARIDCVRRLLLSDLDDTNPVYDFFTVFDFGERQFDNCFEMGDSELVMKAIAGMRQQPRVSAKFSKLGWTEEYLQSRGFLNIGVSSVKCALDLGKARGSAAQGLLFT